MLRKASIFDIISNRPPRLSPQDYFPSGYTIEIFFMEKFMKFDSWHIVGYDRPVAVSLSRAGLPPLVSVLLASRGIYDIDAAAPFLCDDITALGDPFLLRDMDKAVSRINTAVENKEHIAIYGDYDVDGMTASCLLADFFRAHGLACEIYIPCRFEEGYGVNTCALDHLRDLGVTLVITVDCGITAKNEASYARSIGLDLIITDHHECEDELPDALAVINPKRRDCTYPNKTLAGVGVAFKLLCALDGDTTSIIEKYSDFVALGTIADVLPVTAENRTLIRYGINVLNNLMRPGLRRLIAKAHLNNRRLSSSDIGFTLAPRLNAAGRMGRSSLAVELLLTKSETEAELLATELDSLNSQRRELESNIFQDALLMARQDTPHDIPIVLASRGWYQGVMGIVASRMAERFMAPVVMIALEDDGVGRGSCRSFANFNLYAAIATCSDLLENFGGHESAAGLTISEDNIPEFIRRLREYCSKASNIPPPPALNIDFEVLKPGLLSVENIIALSALEPFGAGNPLPILCIKGAKIESVTPLGGGRHTKFRISKNGEFFDCLSFSRTSAELGTKAGLFCDIAFTPQINAFRGLQSVQLLITDIRISEDIFTG